MVSLRTGNYVSKVLALVSFLVVLSSCQKFDDSTLQREGLIKSSAQQVAEVSDDMVNYWGPETFQRGSGEPVIVEKEITNPQFACFDGNFILTIRNGDSKNTRVSSAEIKIDGMLVAAPRDFSKNVTLIIKPLAGLKPGSLLEVKLNGAPDSFIDLRIEGKKTIITPLFTQMGPLLKNSLAPALPATSLNGISGTWDPEKINTSSAGTFTYTFTPGEGQCGDITTMDIEISDKIYDIDGNPYNIIKLGEQFWMTENLKTTHYQNGDPIGTTTPATLNISAETSPKYLWAYGGNETNVGTYGRLYTWYTITDSRKVCPEGWHIPSDTEWSSLTTYLVNNGYGYEGSGTDIGKSMATISGWLLNSVPGNIGNNQGANNSSGFNAVPAGYRTNTGSFAELKMDASWWSSTESSVNDAFYRRLDYNNSVAVRAFVNKKYGGAVRCIKDN